MIDSTSLARLAKFLNLAADRSISSQESQNACRMAAHAFEQHGSLLGDGIASYMSGIDHEKYVDALVEARVSASKKELGNQFEAIIEERVRDRMEESHHAAEAIFDRRLTEKIAEVNDIWFKTNNMIDASNRADLERLKQDHIQALSDAQSDATAARSEARKLRAANAILNGKIASLNTEIATIRSLHLASRQDPEPIEPEMVVNNMPSDASRNVRQRAAAKRVQSSAKRSKIHDLVSDQQPREAPRRAVADCKRLTPRRWTRLLKARLSVLTWIGRSLTTIARTLSREFGLPISVGDIRAAMARRWIAKAA